MKCGLFVASIRIICGLNHIIQIIRIDARSANNPDYVANKIHIEATGFCL